MSASLVGSEMCIRDSSLTGPSLCVGGLLAADARRTRAEHCSSAHNPEPVSYTHLTLPTICSV
eukprot:5464388-Alexandrium_andersonii.AAC.1